MTVPDNTATRATEAADAFVKSYYAAVNDGKPVVNYYINSSPAYSAHPRADLCINGLVVATPEEWDKMLLAQRHVPAPAGQRPSTTRYEVETFDAHVINSNYCFGATDAQLAPDPSKPDQGAGTRLMMMLSVSGTVHFGSDRDSLKQHFNDVFVLVPNWASLKHSTSRSTGKRFLIMSHTYRAY